jgi:hypothetical protein
MALNDNALTERDTVKTELGIDLGDTSQDALIDRLINAVSSAMDKHCRRVFARGTLSEKVAGKGTPVIMLERPPIVSVATVDEDGEALTEGDDFEIHHANTATLYKIGGAWLWRTMGTGGIKNDPLAGYERKLITVGYDGGYTTPHQVTTAAYPGPSTLPAEIEEAAIFSVVAAYHSSGQDRRIANERLMDAAVAYAARNRITGRGMGGILVDESIDILAPYILAEC